jgi:hypothetical protein
MGLVFQSILSILNAVHILKAEPSELLTLLKCTNILSSYIIIVFIKVNIDFIYET